MFRYGIRCGNRCGSSGPDRALEFLRFFLPAGLCLQLLSSFRVLLVCKVEPEKSLLQFFASCIFSHSCPQDRTIIRLFGQGLSCILSCISPKKLLFLPRNGRFRFFSYLHCFSLVYQCFLHKHRPKSADKPACISLGYHHITFSMINSKCDRAFVAPPEFKSLMLRQSTVQCAFLSALYRFFMQKAEFLSLTIS